MTVAAGSFTIWQLPPQTRSQMMSYVLRTVNDSLIVIDGGMSGDAAYLARFIAELGGRVRAWFITHHHHDHIDAVSGVLEQAQRPVIDVLYESAPGEDWTSRYDSHFLPNLRRFNSASLTAALKTEELALGQMLEFDGLRIEILGIKNPELQDNGLNDQSVVLRMSDSCKSALFLGDLGVAAGNKLLAGRYRDRLHADIVQMAHHGQAGVSEEFYHAVRPACCLWPTPQWLWDNDAGQGVGTGPWLTLQVRQWMATLGVHQHFIAAQGLCRID